MGWEWGWGDINIHIDINMNSDIHIIINMNIAYSIISYYLLFMIMYYPIGKQMSTINRLYWPCYCSFLGGIAIGPCLGLAYCMPAASLGTTSGAWG